MRRERSSLLGTAMACAVALVVGLGLGGLGPRSEARALRQQVEALSSRSCGESGLGKEMARAFSQRPWQPPADSPPVAPKEVPASPEPSDPGRELEGLRLELDPADPEGSRAQIDEGLSLARDAMHLRRRQALAALQEQARPTPAQMREIEAALDDMNAELLGLAEGFVATMREGEPGRRDVMVFAAETLDALIVADDRLFDLIDPSVRDRVAAEVLDPMSYVDPALMDVLMELEGR